MDVVVVEINIEIDLLNDSVQLFYFDFNCFFDNKFNYFFGYFCYFVYYCLLHHYY